jgi:CRP-like cAMP-binding protein
LLFAAILLLSLMAMELGPGLQRLLPPLNREGGREVIEFHEPQFDAAAFLIRAGLGQRTVQLAPKQPFFAQGEPADSIFFLQKGRAKITVVSHAGKEATLMLLSAGDFVGEEALAAVPGLRSVFEVSAGPQYAHSSRSCRSALQLQ